MPEHVLDDLDVDVGGSGERGGPVSQIVEADRRQPTLGGEAVELVADLARLERLAIDPGEHQVVANMRVVDCVELDSLALLVSDEDTTAEAVESDRSFSGFRLGGVFVDVLANLKELCCDLEQAGFQVDVLPLGPYRLASAEAAEGDEVVQRVEPMGGGVLEEAGGLLGRPHQLRGVDRAFALGVGQTGLHGDGVGVGLGQRAALDEIADGEPSAPVGSKGKSGRLRTPAPPRPARRPSTTTAVKPSSIRGSGPCPVPYSNEVRKRPLGWTFGEPESISPSGSHRSRRDGLPSPESCRSHLGRWLRRVPSSWRR